MTLLQFMALGPERCGFKSDVGEAPKSHGPNLNPHITLLLRDGAIYFAVMALANLLNTLTFYVSEPMLKGTLSTFASTISITMMSRLMLNLHETADAGIFTEGPTSTEHLDYMFPSQDAATITRLESQGRHEGLVPADGVEHQIEMQDFDTRNRGHP